MTKWAYKVWTPGCECPTTEEILNNLGNQGWELAGVYLDSPYARYIFKRPCGIDPFNPEIR